MDFFHGCRHDEHYEIWHQQEVVIHNLNQQEVGNPQLLEKKSFEEKG
jgi:hypothetical protein